MSLCVVIFKKLADADEMLFGLEEESDISLKVQLVKPNNKEPKEEDDIQKNSLRLKQAVEIDSVKLLNPKLTKNLRQKRMAYWLMPFGFIAGLTFTQMTGLRTFESLGIPPIAEPIIGSFLGMGSGWMGSYFAAGSVNPLINEDIDSLRKLSAKGYWFVIVESPFEVELPWGIIKSSKNFRIIRLNEN